MEKIISSNTDIDHLRCIILGWSPSYATPWPSCSCGWRRAGETSLTRGSRLDKGRTGPGLKHSSFWRRCFPKGSWQNSLHFWRGLTEGKMIESLRLRRPLNLHPSTRCKIDASFFNCPQFLFPFLAMLHGEWRCKTISNFCLRITKKQSKFEGVVKPWKTVLSIHFSNLFPQPAQMTWINGKKIGMFWLLWKSENLLQQKHYICRGKNHQNSCPICPNILQIACTHGLVVLKSVTKKKPKNRFWLAVGCKQMDQEEEKWAQSWIYERIRPKWCCHGKLFPLEKQSIARVWN